MRNNLVLSVFLAMLASSIWTTATADEIYRWVDEDGVVHFGDDAEGRPDAERIEIEPENDNGLGKAASSSFDSSVDKQTSLAQQRRDERAAQRELAAEKQKQAASQCEAARAQVAQLEPSPRVLVTDESGNVSRLDDNRRLELLAEAKTYIAENCGK